jgi:hypothetical protein
MKRKNYLVLFFVVVIFFVLFTLSFFSLGSTSEITKSIKNSFCKFDKAMAAESNNVDLNVNITAAASPSPSASPSGSISPTPSGSPYPSGSESPSGSPSPSGSASTSPWPSGSVSPSPTPGPIDVGWQQLSSLAQKLRVFNFVIALILLLGPQLASIALAFLDPFSPFPLYLYYVWLSFLELIGVRKRGKSWGTVYNYSTKKPVSLAVVRIIDAATGQIKDTSISTKSGAFSFLAESGRYFLKVFKSGYRFPPEEIGVADNQIWQRGRLDAQFENIYTGGIVIVKNEDQGLINCNLPIVYTGESVYSQNSKFWAGCRRVLTALRMPILILGTFVALIALTSRFDIFNLLIFVVYLLIWFLEIYKRFIGSRAMGHVYDEVNQPVSLALVRLIETGEKGERVRVIKATDSSGRFNMIAMPGRYYLSASKAGYRYYRSEKFDITNEKLIDFDLRLKNKN